MFSRRTRDRRLELLAGAPAIYEREEPRLLERDGGGPGWEKIWSVGSPPAPKAAARHVADREQPGDTGQTIHKRLPARARDRNGTASKSAAGVLGGEGEKKG